jgi:hypothetical protein
MSKNQSSPGTLASAGYARENVAGACRAAMLGGVAVLALAAPAKGAELPASPEQPPQFLATCAVGDMTGYLVAGSGICLNISGYVSGLAEVGNLTKEYTLAPTASGSKVTSTLSGPTALRDSLGFTTRAQIDFDAREMTEHGVLRAYAEIQADPGNGFEPADPGMFLNLGYIQWAGVTAGRAGSFFSYLAGGPAWYDFYSPDRVTFNQPELFAYTATLGHGVTATISLEDPIGASVDNAIFGTLDNSDLGEKYPDVIANLRVDQNWGSAQLSGAAHNTRVEGAAGDAGDIWGYAALAGATINLPAFGVGDRIAAQGVWTHAALGYSGIPNAAWSAGDQGFNLNGNGTIFQLTDAFNYAPGRWTTPTAWTAAAFFEHHFSPQFSIIPEISFAGVRYGDAPGTISAQAVSALGGVVGHWDPLANLDIQLAVMFESTHQATPAAYVGPTPFSARSSGIAGNLSITRTF